MTGPKISSTVTSSPCRRPDTTVGVTKKPSPSCDARPPPASMLAWSGSRSSMPSTRDSWSGLLTGPTSTPASRGMPERRGPRGLGERGREVGGHGLVHEHPGRGGAVLPGVEVAGARRCPRPPRRGRRRRRRAPGALPPSSRWTRLSPWLAASATCMPGPDRAGDGDHVRAVVADDRAAGVPVADDDVEHARRQELRGDLGEQQRALRRGVARLDDDGVAGRDRGGELPRRHVQRVVPRRHLADRRRPARGGRSRCGPPCTPRPRGPRASGRRRRRSGSGRPSAGSPRSSVRSYGLPVSCTSRSTSSAARASTASAMRSSASWRSRGGGVAPAGEGRGGGGVGGVDVLGAAARGPGDHLRGGRVDEVVGGVGGGRHVLPADEVAQQARGGRRVVGGCRHGAGH